MPTDDPSSIVRRTLSHYETRAEGFWEGTRDHDVSQNREALLRHIQGRAPFTLLDFGCGPGRDLIAFTELGHTAVGLDGAAKFCEMARTHSGCEVLEQNMLALDLAPGKFDGIFANASLFHVPTDHLRRVLRDLHGALVPGGTLLCSNPRGENDEGWNGERYGAYHSYETWTAHVQSCGFDELEHYYRPPGRPKDQQPWLVTVYRKAPQRPTRVNT